MNRPPQFGDDSPVIAVDVRFSKYALTIELSDGRGTPRGRSKGDTQGTFLKP
jgi:hypothetical protein